MLEKFGIKRNTPILGKKSIEFLGLFVPSLLLVNSKPEIQCVQEKIRERVDEVDIEEEIPLIAATTIWGFPRQSYGLTQKGDNKYPCVTPALIIYNLIWRYTDPSELVVDPMCGSGTTIDS